jgi:cytochrome c oxidase cbb3-type subunit I/II
VYSYKLSILHFWTLIFLYIWAGPHHLLYSSTPDWVQSLGVVFSIMLIAPSWGGMINGLLTLRGAWDRVQDDVTLKFMVVSLTAYGMATFEGPMLSLKNINAIAHFTDWVVAHVHVGALGFNGFMLFAIAYWLVPRLYQTSLFSKKLASAHFWLGTLGILVYAIPMYWAGFTQGLMWKEFTPDGMLKYPNFLETSTKIIPLYAARGIGGTLYLAGFLIMLYNLAKTAAKGSFLASETSEAVVWDKVEHKGEYWHKVIENRPMLMLILSLIVVSIGGLIQIIPTLMIKSNIPTISSVKPYTPLELEGRDVYIKEGCNNCHSQMIRPFRSETERYGEYSKSGEYVYDHPFLWGSKRTGPDLMREGGKYPNSWHYHHMRLPGSMSPGSIMPAYPWLLENELDASHLQDKMKAMKTLGVPYTDQQILEANVALKEQADAIAANLKQEKIDVKSNKEIIALIAYLQRLGTDIKVK